jgi:hypothetical protein
MIAERAAERWSVLAEDVFCPAAAAWGDRGVSVFMRGATGDLLVREREADSFGDLRSLGVPMARVEGSRVPVPVEWPIAACSSRDGDLHLLARGVEGDLVHGRLRGKDWSGFQSIGVPIARGRGLALPMGLAGAPTACCRERGRLDVFAVAGEGDLLHTVYEGSGFSECESLGAVAGTGPVFGAISAFDAGLRAMGIVARGSGDVLVKLWTAQQQWRPFAPLRGIDQIDPLDPALEWMRPLTGPPAACGGGSSRADAFVRGPRGHLFHAWWNGERWSEYQSLGMPGPAESDATPFTAGPIACAWGKYRLDVFACATDGKLYHSRSSGTWPGPDVPRGP